MDYLAGSTTKGENMSHWNWGVIGVNLGIATDAIAAIGYALQGDWKHAYYWASGTSLMIAVRLL